MTAKSFEEIVGEAIGEASMAWSETPTGVFDSQKCIELTDRIVQARKNSITTKEATDVFRDSLLIDKEYYAAWQASIAMAFQDEFWSSSASREHVHAIAKNAANMFLGNLIKYHSHTDSR